MFYTQSDPKIGFVLRRLYPVFSLLASRLAFGKGNWLRPKNLGRPRSQFPNFASCCVSLCLLAGLSLSLPHLYQTITHGVRLGKCRFEWPFISEWEAAPLPLDQEKKIFSQPFTYLGKGRQSYVFESRDGRYVLKLFRLGRSKIMYGRETVRTLRKAIGLKVREEKPFEERMAAIFSSCKQIFERGAHLSQLVWIHLNPKKGTLPPILLRDRWGRKIWVNPEKDRFVIQRKGEVFFIRLKAQRDRKPMIQAYLRLLDQLAGQGLSITDPTMGRNFGYLDGEAFLLDVGSIVYNPKEAEATKVHFISRLEQWMEAKNSKVPF